MFLRFIFKCIVAQISIFLISGCRSNSSEPYPPFSLGLADLSTSNPLPKVNDIDVDFVGIDGIYHALKYWQIEDRPLDLISIVKNKIGNYETFDGILDNEFVHAQTANATYISALLYGPNGLFNDNPKKITSALPNKTDKGRLLTWTRGFLLVKYASQT